MTDILRDAHRLAAVKDATLVDSPTQESLDRLAGVASYALHAPVSLVSIVDQDRQCFIGRAGLAEPWASTRVTPLSHSFCQHAVRSGQPLIVENARADQRVRDNLAIRDLNVIAYAGYPLVTGNGEALGTFCAIDSLPRVWRSEELELLQQFARLALSLVDAHVERVYRERGERELRHEQKMNALGRLAVGIVHDFNNVLQVVDGQIDVLETRDLLGIATRPHIAEIHGAMERGSQLTQQILSFCRGEETTVTALDLTTAVTELDSFLRALVRRRANLTVELPDRPLFVRLGGSRLQQVLVNLLTNAIEAMPESGLVRIVLREADHTDAEALRELQADASEWVVLQVVDEGRGIDPEVRDQIFEPFVTTKFGGASAGLGLATVHQIVYPAGGRIRVVTEPGVGTTFSIYLPRVDATG